MNAVALEQELTNEAAVTPTDPYVGLARLSFQTRKELLEAARVLAPGHLFSTYVSQHSTVVSSAQSRSVNNVR